MNKDWLKRNGIAVVFLIGFVIFLGYDIWKLQQAIRHRRAVEEELQREEQRLQQLLRGEIFPSSENVRILRSNREQLEGLYSQIVHRVARAVPTPTLNRVQFRAMLTQKLNELFDTAREKNVVLPANFAFGFDEYLGTLPPENRAILNVLTKQLLVVERLVQLLYAAPVEEIQKIERPSADAVVAELGAKSEELYQRMSFTLEFTTSTAGLQKFLNQLPQQDWVLMVRHMSVETIKVTRERPGTRPTTAPMPQPGEVDPGLFARLGPGLPPAMLPTPTAPAAPPQIVKELLSVRLTVDLVEVAPSQKPGRRT